ALAALTAVGAIVCLLQARALDDGAATEARWLQSITDHYRPLARDFDPNLAPEAVTTELVHQVLFTAVDADGTHVDQLQRGRLRLQQQLEQQTVLLLVGAALLLAL